MVNTAQVVKVRGINYVQLVQREWKTNKWKNRRWSTSLELTTENGEEISIELNQDSMEEIYKKLADKLRKKMEEV